MNLSDKSNEEILAMAKANMREKTLLCLKILREEADSVQSAQKLVKIIAEDVPIPSKEIALGFKFAAMTLVIAALEQCSEEKALDALLSRIMDVRMDEETAAMCNLMRVLSQNKG